MKKKSGSRIVRVFNRIIKVRTWVDWDRVKSLSFYLLDGFQRLFVPQKPTRVESFDEAMQRLKINNVDLYTKQNALFRLSIIMLTVAVLMFIYMGYQFFYGSFKATIVSLVIMFLAIVLAFRYHFWYFQIKRHKLGCTIKEWYRQGLMGEKE